MPRKPRYRKPDEQRKKVVPKTTRKETTDVLRMRVVTKRRDGKSLGIIAKETGLPKTTVAKIYRRAMNKSMDLQIHVDDPEIYRNAPGRGRPFHLSDEDGDAIFQHVISTRENREKTAMDHIREMELPGSGNNKFLSESKFNQIMYDRGCHRGSRGWKTILSDVHKANRVTFCQRYQDFDWVKYGMATDEAKAKKAELSKTKVWKRAGEELDPNVIGRKELEYDKQMAQVAAHIAHGFKSKLTFFYEETNTAKKAAEKVLEKENEGEDPLHHLAWAATQVAQIEEEERSGRKTSGRKPQYEKWRNRTQKTRGDRSKGGVDGFRYRDEYLYPSVVPNMKMLRMNGRDMVMIEDNAAAHSGVYDKETYARYGLNKFWDWPPKSPDLNPIEKAWGWCRHWLQQHHTVARNRTELEDQWRAAWDALPQSLIDGWFEKMSETLQKCINAKGDNDFHS